MNQEPKVISPKEAILEAISSVQDGIAEISTLEDVDDVAYSVLDALEESGALVTRIAQARKSGDRVTEGMLVSKQKELFNDIRSEIALIAGIETDEERVKKENAEYRNNIVNMIDGNQENVDIDNVLERLGMLKKDDGGELHFNYPEGLFPPHIDEKWDHYADIVARHTTAITSRQTGESNDIEIIAQLDAIRTVAHNNLSYAIKDFLNLETWDLEKCRRLVIKMRDSLYPTIETAEKHTTSSEIMRLIQTVRELAKKK